jgi:hypothetical protein
MRPCSFCLQPAAHFTEVGGGGLACDECVRGGLDPFSDEPAEPGINAPEVPKKTVIRVELDLPGKKSA